MMNLIKINYTNYSGKGLGEDDEFGLGFGLGSNSGFGEEEHYRINYGYTDSNWFELGAGNGGGHCAGWVKNPGPGNGSGFGDGAGKCSIQG
jgi:hypothetical protein